MWIAATLVFAALWLWGGEVLPWAFEVPRAWRPPFAAWISGVLDWLTKEAHFGLFTFRDLTRFISAVIDVPYQIALGLLSGGATVFGVPVPPVGWLGVTLLVALLGFVLSGLPLAALAGGAFFFIAIFGQWTSAMLTLASILVAVPLGVGGGLLLGIAGHRWTGFGRAIVPFLDLMQTIPIFAYLVPILILFGFGPTSAMIATLIYAMPPMTRITMLALQRVPDEIVDLGRMIGCTPRQMTWRVMVPSAQEALMVGVNQVIMLSLNMVIIASMIGAGGLGFDVLSALRRLDFGAGLEAGFAIVALAIALDRLSQAAARRRPAAPVSNEGIVGRHPFLLSALTVLILATLAGLAVPAVQTYPETGRLSTGTFWSEVVEYININYFDEIEAAKNAVLLNVLIPVKRFLISLPWLGVAGLLTLAGWRLGGPRLALLAGGLTVLVASTGLWEEAMTTVYLCGIAVLIAMLIGLPIGILVAERDRLWASVRVIIDTLQTLPAFVYLMPAVMLFRVGDFTAMIAIVAFALAPAIRYTVLGLRGVDPALIEAGKAMGCTPWQIVTRIRLRLAMPEILLGLNQTIMFALSMLVITALVGTRDLGQEVYIALTKADAGRGLVAGLCVAFIAIIADRLIHAAASRSRAQLGLSDGGGHDAA
ncbi:glycine betaine/proline transport system permease protein [Silicimonas algicola]|uniref:Glycine betaine/proline transport system permease protein n=2 Tax=Silicimonas algicola TaxID=1826607 RepID=A0A316FYS3_9RHOB|nr:glycine betaine/proline transport system permease protein [Silicimonas algicola]